tara:strand:- start:1433 stop:4150 length:2718 start_codon:yes stop_codon:yes gene_type:complete
MKGRWNLLIKTAQLAVAAWLLLFPSKSLAQSPETFILSQENLNSVKYTDSLNFYPRLEDLKLDSSMYQFISDQTVGLERPVKNGAWIAFELENNLNIVRFLYLRFCQKADTVLLFNFPKTSLPTLSLASGRQAPSERIIFSSSTYLPVTIPRQEKVLFVAYVRFPKNDSDPHFNELFISNAQTINYDYVNRASVQFFFAGFIILLSIIAAVASVLLRSKSLVYYALVMPFTIIYFHQQMNINAYLIEWLPWFDGYQQANTALVFEILIGFFFISEYLELKTKLLSFYRFYGAVTLQTLIALLTVIFLKPGVWINIFLIIWLLTSLGITLYLSLKGEKSARILLLSFGVLILGAIFLALDRAGMVTNFHLAAYAFQIGTLLFSLILFYALAVKVNSIRLEKLKADGISKMKTQFFQDISHELRTPLSLVIDPLERVLKDMPTSSTKEVLRTAHQASQGLLNLVNQILDLSKLDSVPIELSLKPVRISAHLEILMGSFRSLADEKGIKLEFQSECKNLVIGLDSLRFQQIVNNLLSNALKFTPAGGKVLLRLFQDENGFVVLSVKDNGFGISEKSLPHIFDRYFQAPENKNAESPGTGIGLALTKALVEQHQGSIAVTSKLGEGTCFTIKLATDLLPEDELVLPEELFYPGVDNDPKGKSKPLVLIIEDHPQLRAYLLGQLKEHYRVLEAADGKSGLSLAQEHMPDLVVSDLMMPFKDGYEITRSLKSDLRTSHIPVILLTAKAGQEAKNRGLEIGADDYLLKPFNTEELLLRISNLMKQRAEWRNLSRKTDLPNINKDLLNRVDREFLEKLDGALETHHAEANFSVEDLAAAVAMSKTHLNRKLKALLDLSANKVIQNYRLEKAKSKLEAKDGNVSEIALLSGFNSTTYFVKVFKDKYGTTPGSFL